MTESEKTAVVTGAAGGIGRVLVKQFVERGFNVIAGDADAKALEDVASNLNRNGPAVWTKAGDLRSKAYCEELIDFAVQTTGRLDALVNNAGIITRGTIVETSDEDWERTWDINVTAIFYTCRRAIASMKDHGGGSIVNIWSCWGLYPGPGHPAYCASKAAVASLSKCLGRDHAGDGIRVNAVCPNEVNTPMLRTGFIRRGFDPDTAIEQLNRTVPLGRIAEPEDIADVVSFLTSDASRYIVGTAIEVNGAKPVY
ncbi:SDR family NAD(P)-dependent oxidoreductase [Rhizobium sp. BR 362]|uniref:SDR family NAD(P)-dependent oxidoreductase n=1 Tax=Rhizobium sp. BR 362 TaxID=3040670 RepID=UPI002F419534